MEDVTNYSNLKIKKGNFFIRDKSTTLDYDNDKDEISVELEINTNPDVLFGTNVETEENDDYCNFYVWTDPFMEYLASNRLEIIVKKADGTDEALVYHMDEEECRVMLALIIEFNIYRFQDILSNLERGI